MIWTVLLLYFYCFVLIVRNSYLIFLLEERIKELEEDDARALEEEDENP